MDLYSPPLTDAPAASALNTTLTGLAQMRMRLRLNDAVIGKRESFPPRRCRAVRHSGRRLDGSSVPLSSPRVDTPGSTWSCCGFDAETSAKDAGPSQPCSAACLGLTLPHSLSKCSEGFAVDQRHRLEDRLLDGRNHRVTVA